MRMELISTQFNEFMGMLIEESHMQSSLHDAKATIEEFPPVPGDILSILEEMGLPEESAKRAAEGGFAAILEPRHGVRLILSCPSRPEALVGLGQLERLFAEGFQNLDPLEVDPEGYPEEDYCASLCGLLEVQGVGEIQLIGYGDTFIEAIEAMRLIAPQAYLNS